MTTVLWDCSIIFMGGVNHENISHEIFMKANYKNIRVIQQIQKEHIHMSVYCVLS